MNLTVKPTLTLLTAMLLAPLAALHAADNAPYPVAKFSIEHAVINEVYPKWSPKMGYNHDSDITLFKGRYVAVWNANPEIPEESRPGQLNYLSVSDDFQKWSVPVALFTSQGGATNPVDSTGMSFQWQPNFINLRNQTLFCAWCVTGPEAATYVSKSSDGLHWENIRITDPLPKSYDSGASPNATPFPSNHGLLTKSGSMLFPICLAPAAMPKGKPLQVCALISKDVGKSWHWGEFTPVLPVQQFLKPGKTNTGDKKDVHVWEPHFFEHPDGRIGLLVRVSNAAPEDGLTADQMILYAESKDGGVNFSTPRAVDIETISSRHQSFSMARSSSDLMLVANDWLPGYSRTLRDRHFLSLYFSPVCDPDFLIPGPVIQQRGTTGHYPNGEINNGEMIISYSYGVKPRAIYASRIKNLPDFRTPFFLRRESRPAMIINEADRVAYFPETFSSLGLVLTKDLTEQKQLTLEFAAKLLTVPAFYPGQSMDEAVNGMTLLTIGAVDHHTTQIRVTRPLPPYHVEVLRDHKWVKVTEVTLREPIRVSVEMTDKDYTVRVNDAKSLTVSGKLNRKINFGGFYTDPIAYPSAGSFELDLKTVRVR
ncbi:MAG: exo-alpha-sialidase [Lentisphaerae bacterium]|nr:exo-alpha-sialidase [Lentisphaerota bacterium]